MEHLFISSPYPGHFGLVAFLIPHMNFLEFEASVWLEERENFYELNVKKLEKWGYKILMKIRYKIKE